MKRIYAIFFTLAALCGCDTIAEDYSGCPPPNIPELRVRFNLADEFDAGGHYDSSVGNDVMLYIFKDKKLTHASLVPFDAIKQGAHHAITKTPETTGDLDFVAWAVPHGERLHDRHTPYTLGDGFDDKYMEHGMSTRADDFYTPVYHRLYKGHLSETVSAEGHSDHTIDVAPAACRVAVNVVDNFGALDDPGAAPGVLVEGVMSRMNHTGHGTGEPATVAAPFQPSGDGVNYTTSTFGVLPSAAGQTVSVKIIAGGGTIATLTLPGNKPAVSGGMLVFDYVLDAPYFEITIGDWTEKIYRPGYI